MNSRNSRIHLCVIDEDTVLLQTIAARKNDVVAFRHIGNVLEANVEFAATHFGEVPLSIRLATRDKIDGVPVTAWAACLSPSAKAAVNLRLLVEETNFGGLIHKYGTFTVQLEEGCAVGSSNTNNTLIDLDEPISLNSVLIHQMPAHFVFFRKTNADERILYEVQELSGLCFYNSPVEKKTVPSEIGKMQKNWGLQRDDQIVVCCYPKETGFLHFLVAAYECSSEQSRKLFRKSVIQALVI